MRVAEGLGPMAMLFLAGLAALWPTSMAWAYVAAFAVFELWLLRRLRRERGVPVLVDAPPYRFTGEEAALIERYRFYFASPELARHAASTLAALGLGAIVLSPWLIFRGELVAAVLVALNIPAVGALTRRVAPVMALRMAAHGGDRDALRMLELHDPLWRKIRDANTAPH